MRVLGPAQMLEIFGRIFNQSFIKRPQIHGRMPERILTEKMVKVPVDKLPVKTIIVGNKHWPTF